MKRTLLLAIALMSLSTPAGAGEGFWDEAKEALARLEEQASSLVTIGGVVVYRYRHTISGATMGCVAGALVGTSSTVVLSPVTGGASLSGTVPAAALGCAVGGVAGSALGHSLDTTGPTLLE